MTGFFTALSPLGTFSLIVLFFILARLSEKLGAVTKMAPHYRWFWVGLGFLVIALFAQLLRIGVLLAEQASYLWLDTSAFYLRKPSNIRTQIDYDPISGDYLISEKIGATDYRLPFFTFTVVCRRLAVS